MAFDDILRQEKIQFDFNDIQALFQNETFELIVIRPKEIEVVHHLESHEYKDASGKAYEYKDCFEVKYTILPAKSE